jgi:hypothetical protein
MLDCLTKIGIFREIISTSFLLNFPSHLDSATWITSFTNTLEPLENTKWMPEATCVTLEPVGGAVQEDKFWHEIKGN